MAKNKKIEVKGTEITIYKGDVEDYISLTDIARYKDSSHTDDIIKNWLRNRNTIELLGFWEQMYNPNFKPVEFDGFRKQAGLNSFVLTPKRWIETTNAIGIISKSGRYGGTFAHKDIAFEFASWISIEFKLYVIKEFQRLKEDENNRQKLDWNLQRTLAKVNYTIHTDAIKERLIPEKLTPKQTYNLSGTLNLPFETVKPKARIPKLKLPSRLIEIVYKDNSTTTLLVSLNEGWQISFRIHNASSRVEPSLKFDINLLSTPHTLFTNHIFIS